MKEGRKDGEKRKGRREGGKSTKGRKTEGEKKKIQRLILQIKRGYKYSEAGFLALARRLPKNITCPEIPQSLGSL